MKTWSILLVALFPLLTVNAEEAKKRKTVLTGEHAERFAALAKGASDERIAIGDDFLTCQANFTVLAEISAVAQQADAEIVMQGQARGAQMAAYWYFARAGLMADLYAGDVYELQLKKLRRAVRTNEVTKIRRFSSHCEERQPLQVAIINEWRATRGRSEDDRQ